MTTFPRATGSACSTDLLPSSAHPTNAQLQGPTPCSCCSCGSAPCHTCCCPQSAGAPRTQGSAPGDGATCASQEHAHGALGPAAAGRSAFHFWSRCYARPWCSVQPLSGRQPLRWGSRLLHHRRQGLLPGFHLQCCDGEAFPNVWWGTSKLRHSYWQPCHMHTICTTAQSTCPGLVQLAVCAPCMAACSHGCNSTFPVCDYSPAKQHFDEDSGMCKDWRVQCNSVEVVLVAATMTFPFTPSCGQQPYV